MKQSNVIRISKDAHDILRYNSYKENKRITDIIDDLVKDLPKPSLSDKISRMVAKKQVDKLLELIKIKIMSTLKYVKPTEEQLQEMESFRNKFELLFDELKARHASRGMSLCLTKFEESAMWLNKAITNND